MIRITTIFVLLLSIFVSACAQQGKTEEKTETTEIQNAAEVINKDITVAEFQELYDPAKHVLLDVRTPEEWEEGHLPNAVHLNFYEDNFAEELDKLEKDKAYVVYCKAGGRSGKTLAMLNEKGFTEAYNILGGYTELEAQGVETVTD